MLDDPDWTPPTMPDDPARQRPLLIVLTGGIASGKSAAADHFARLGAPVIDTDILAREVVATGQPALEQIRAEFGAAAFQADGTLNRRALRERIFSDDEQRKRLEAILHPRIVDRARRRLAEVDAPYAILVVPLLVETGLFADADRVLVVDVPESVQIERLLKRDGVDRAAAEAALAAQVTRDQRLAHADDVIDNTGTLEALHAQVADLDRQYRKLAGRRKNSDRLRSS